MEQHEPPASQMSMEEALIATLDLMDFYAHINGPQYQEEQAESQIQWTELKIS